MFSQLPAPQSSAPPRSPHLSAPTPGSPPVLLPLQHRHRDPARPPTREQGFYPRGSPPSPAPTTGPAPKMGAQSRMPAHAAPAPRTHPSARCPPGPLERNGPKASTVKCLPEPPPRLLTTGAPREVRPVACARAVTSQAQESAARQPQRRKAPARDTQSRTLGGRLRRSPLGRVSSLLSSSTEFKFSTHSGSTSPSKTIHWRFCSSPLTLSMILAGRS